MRTLAIDSATQACSVALFDGRALVAGELRNLGRGHAEALVPMIAALPGKGRADRILVSLGPGSFTGVRVGIAAARGLALAWGVPVHGIPTLALVAAMARSARGEDPVDVAMTGGHGEWFFQSFDGRGSALDRVQSLPPEVAASHSRASLVAGNEAGALVALRGNGAALTLLPDAREALLVPAEQWCTSLSPIYGRAPDARPLAQ